jgi:hypothetical protein
MYHAFQTGATKFFEINGPETQIKFYLTRKVLERCGIAWSPTPNYKSKGNQKPGSRILLKARAIQRFGD